ncbi:hypothetical protein K443DRAFT_679501 [Laccaria amethystina LaAM-08-1]|jgi:hypothetical protein|uniref:Unplaced genomic scaffold K443scaffold_99, whole genome shotgun sequence n=1 Tax=Laccaria amethystina LaAM-08-1 TaxID=1095629 RepID=A0A0C9WPQ7_9AGAR|nr:hypothetical protein K443DRAFT_679501 [Laccaria amethystina LaAM-08-1]
MAAEDPHFKRANIRAVPQVVFRGTHLRWFTDGPIVISALNVRKNTSDGTSGYKNKLQIQQ